LNYQDPNNSSYIEPITIEATEVYGSNILTFAPTSVLKESYVGSPVFGDGIPSNTVITSINSTKHTAVMSNTATAGGQGAQISIIVGSDVMDVIKVELSINVIDPETVCYLRRSDLVYNLNLALQSHRQLTKESSISIVDVSYNDASGNTITYQEFKLNIRLNRSTTTQLPNMKQIVIFPDETNNTNPIWTGFTSTGENSAFMFDNKLDELNDVYSDTSPLSLTYTITSSPTIIFKCITSPYSTDPSNTYTVTIPNGTYTKNTYINTLQTSILNQLNSQPNINIEILVFEDMDKSVLTFEVSLRKELAHGTISEVNYSLIFNDSSSTNSWKTYLGLASSSYNFKSVQNADYSKVVAENPILDNDINIDSKNNTFTIAPQSNVNGLYTAGGENTVSVIIPDGHYAKTQLYSEINKQLQANPMSAGSYIKSVWDSTGVEYVKIRPNINKIYTAQDYNLTFYNFTDYVSCLTMPNGNTTLTPISWTSTLGWLLGFNSQTSYVLSNKTEYLISNKYTYDPNTKIITITSDAVPSVTNISNIYITVEDYAQNHINDGIVNIAQRETIPTLPPYTSKATLKCDPATGKKMLSYNNANKPGELLSGAKFYSASETLNSNSEENSHTNLVNTTATSIKNILSIVFPKLPTWGQPIVDNGGQNLNQDRKYFGPVNISRLTLQLINDQGYLIDLNGSDWSLTLLCDSLYTSHELKK
jgi:hypothetical protein